MDRTAPPLVTIAICLAALAGFVDALAFTSLGGFFASFMSGNSTRLGVGLGGHGLGDAATAVALVLSFVAGVILASVIVRARPEGNRALVMTAVTALLLAGAVVATLAPGPIALLLLAAAMGCENGVFHRDGEVTIGVTYMTGALVRMGQKAANALMGDTDRWAWVPYLALWLGFVCGAVLGAASHLRWGWNALWLAPVAAAVLTVALRRR
ncbi:MAG: DUF1275 domain-containing protein [Sphingomonadales bacterium]|nr:MAG: DUF1275 domain-containing protein [Sphingomonadales bacterium]